MTFYNFPELAKQEWEDRTPGDTVVPSHKSYQYSAHTLIHLTFPSLRKQRTSLLSLTGEQKS
jgi:hypothetical protein